MTVFQLFRNLTVFEIFIVPAAVKLSKKFYNVITVDNHYGASQETKVSNFLRKKMNVP